MKRIIRKAAQAACALLCLAALSGCLDGKPGRVAQGGDDIPNDVEPLGKRAATARDDSADWNGFASMPRSAPGMYDTASVPDSVPDTSGAGQAQPKGGAGAGGAPALARRSAMPGAPSLPGADSLPGNVGNAQDTLASRAGLLPLDSLPLVKPVDTLVTRVVDTAKGTVEAVHAQVKDNTRTIDSTVFVPPDPAKPGSQGGVLQVAGRVTFADTSIWKTYLFRDADGDGILAPHAGAANLADIRLASKGPGGLVTSLSQRIAAGADLDFNQRGDNRVLSSLVAVTLGADTLRTWRLLDADGDSVVLDFSKDTNLVDLIETDRNPQDTGASSLALSVRLVVYSKDSTRNYAVAYRSTLVRKDGGTVSIHAAGPRPDSTFRPGDDAVWTETRAYAAGDLELSERAYTVRLPAAPGAFAADLLLRYRAHAAYKAQAYSAFDFLLIPAAPVADGRWPAGGSVEASLSYRDGAATAFTGEADAAGMTGALKDVSGASLNVSFDRQGRLTTAR
jgi:hypothetical protein